MIDLYLFRTALRDLLRVRRLPLYGLLVLLPAAVAIVLRVSRGSDFDPSVAYNALSASLVFGFLLVILSVVFGTGVVSREIEQKTIVYLLTRPVPRWRILLARFLAAIAAITLTVWVATGLLAVATWQPGRAANSALFTTASIKNWKVFAGRLRDGSDPLAQYLASQFDEPTQKLLYSWTSDGQPSDDVKEMLAQVLRGRLDDPRLTFQWQLGGVKLSPETRSMLDRLDDSNRREVALHVLKDAFPGAISSTATTRLTADDLIDVPAIAKALRDHSNGVANYVMARMRDDRRRLLLAWDEGGPSVDLEHAILGGLDRIVKTDKGLYSTDRFGAVRLEPQTGQLLAQKPQSGADLARLNRWLLDEAYPDDIVSSRTARSQIARDLLVLPIGALSYGALFMLLATLVSRALIGGLLFAFGWESWVPLLPGSFKLVSLMTYLRVLAPHPQPAAASVDVTDLLNMLSPQTIEPGPAWAVLLSVIAVSVLGAVLIFSRREYVPKDDAA